MLRAVSKNIRQYKNVNSFNYSTALPVTTIDTNNVLNNTECVYLCIKGFSFDEIKNISIDFKHTEHGDKKEDRLKCLDKVSNDYKLVGCNWVSPEE